MQDREFVYQELCPFPWIKKKAPSSNYGSHQKQTIGLGELAGWLAVS